MALPATRRRGLVRTLVTLLIAACALSAPASAVDITTSDPLERAAFTALPAVYDITVRIRVVDIDTGRTTVPVGREVLIQGTGFGVGPHAVTTARHVVRPSPSALIESLRGLDLPALDQIDVGSVRVRSDLLSITLRRAAPASGTGADTQPASVAALSPVGSAADLALLRTGGAGGPALPLDDTTSRGLAVALIGFGESRGTEPQVRTGQLEVAGRTPDGDESTLITVRDIAAQPADSGGPLIDETGGVHGVLIRRGVAQGELAVATRTAVIRQLASQVGLTIEETDGYTAFANGMEAYWANDFRTAAVELGRAAGLVPQSRWISELANDAEQYATAEYEVVSTNPWRIPLLFTAVVFVAVSTALAIRFRQMND